MSQWVRWAAIVSAAMAFAALAIYGYFLTRDSLATTDGAANLADQQGEIPAMSVDVVTQDDWRSSVAPELLQLFDPPDFELRIAEYPEMSGTWRTASATLTPRAEAGDAEAQYLLYRAAYRCFRGPRTSKELETALRRAGANPAELRATYEFCADSPRREIERAIDWVIAAADAGNVRAQIAYSETHFPDDPEIDYPYNAREIAFMAQRRERSLGYLERAKAAGSVDAMVDLFGRHLTFPDDAYHRSLDSSLADRGSPATRAHRKAALANLYAPAWVRLRNSAPDDRHAANSVRGIQRLGAQMPAQDYQDAIEEGRAMLAADSCCLKFRDIK